MTRAVDLAWIDYAVMLIYFVFVLGIGFSLKRFMRTSTDFFLSGRSMPAWITGLAFISANLGAQEVIGMGASGAKYGIATSHFYWIGAIPGDGLRGAVHDAVLLRLARTLGARIFEATLRREDARSERDFVRGNDDLFLRRVDVRDGQAV